MNRVSDSGRVEAFSDGVFAIAITLLVLDLRAPEDARSFIRDLAAEWPSHLAFIAAFAVLGLIWLSHHDLFSRLAGADSSLLLRNLLLLFLVSLFSFPTAVLAAAFRHGGTRTNQMVAIGGFNLTAIAITLAWVYLARVPLAAPHLASDPVEAARYAHKQLIYAGIAYAFLGATFLIGFLSPVASVMLIALLPLINLRFYRIAQQVAAVTQDPPALDASASEGSEP